MFIVSQIKLTFILDIIVFCLLRLEDDSLLIQKLTFWLQLFQNILKVIDLGIGTIEFKF